MKLEQIIKTEKQVLEAGDYSIENNIITRLDLNCIGHFGNIIEFDIIFKNCRISVGGGFNIGQMLKALVEMLDLSEEDGLFMSKIKDVPCRIIIDDSCVIGFGNFMKDKYVFADDFAKIDEF